MLLCPTSNELTDHYRIYRVQPKEIAMSNTLSKARPVIEATLVSLVLVAAALALPAAIIYASV